MRGVDMGTLWTLTIGIIFQIVICNSSVLDKTLITPDDKQTLNNKLEEYKFEDVTIFPEEPDSSTLSSNNETTDATIIPEDSTSMSVADFDKFYLMPFVNQLSSNISENELPDNRIACECGRPSGRIVGGGPASISEYPWTAALTRGGTRPYCGGTLITDRTVLTASHCVDGMTAGQIQVVLYQQAVSENGQKRRFLVTSIRMHPSYDRRTVNNDIAILTISPPVDLGSSSLIVPACVVGSPQFDFTGTQATVLGFGATAQGGGTSDMLRKVTIPVLSNDDCNRSKYAGKITSNMLCAGNLQQGGQDSCQGDSGGPLVIENGGRRTLIGIVSWGYGCAQPNSPGVYTRVQNYGDFILANTKNDNWCSG